ncbi:hypothetical protein [Mesorhizobium sp. BR-1-1-10]|uniref:hypothetical protein n=1 Tax=Mesorhizobium sp. BR-1-1-10 TaxID=2876660 RepID=UPI001CD0881B|nr:hypothetical protein [Mesorhizobium sp. BR-1-1-10]MBZ9975498.1 hypothetical protein [Mesorhizobium sp. BR-1-1-10]
MDTIYDESGVADGQCARTHNWVDITAANEHPYTKLMCTRCGASKSVSPPARPKLVDEAIEFIELESQYRLSKPLAAYITQLETAANISLNAEEMAKLEERMAEPVRIKPELVKLFSDTETPKASEASAVPVRVLGGALTVVSKAEFESFLANYPFPLTTGFCTMTGALQYFDANIGLGRCKGIWPDAVVAQYKEPQYPDEVDEYAIRAAPVKA